MFVNYMWHFLPLSPRVDEPSEDRSIFHHVQSSSFSFFFFFSLGVGGVAHFLFVSCLVFVVCAVLVIFLLLAGRLAFIMCFEILCDIYIYGERERENSNSTSKTLMLKDSSVRSIWTYLTASPCYNTKRERDRDRQTDRQTDRQRQRQTETETEYNQEQACFGLETFYSIFSFRWSWGFFKACPVSLTDSYLYIYNRVYCMCFGP